MKKKVEESFLEGFPDGCVAIYKKNGKYHVIVSRPPLGGDAIFASAESFLLDLIEDMGATSITPVEDDD